MSQTSRNRVKRRGVLIQEKNSGDAVRRLGTIIQSIFCAQSGASIRLTVWKWSGASRYPGAFPPVLENFRRTFSSGRTDCPWVSEDDEKRPRGKLDFGRSFLSFHDSHFNFLACILFYFWATILDWLTVTDIITQKQSCLSHSNFLRKPISLCIILIQR